MMTDTLNQLQENMVLRPLQIPSLTMSARGFFIGYGVQMIGRSLQS